MGLITTPKVTSISGDSGTLSGKISYAEGSGVSITPATDKMTFAVTAAAGTTLIRSNTNTSTLTWNSSNGTTYQEIFNLQHALGSGVSYIGEGFIFLTGVPSATPDFVLKATLLDSSSVNKHKNSTFAAYCVQGANGNGITAIDQFDGTDFTKLETYTNDNMIFFQFGFEINAGTNVYLKISGKQSVATSTTTLSAYNAILNVFRVG